MGNKSTLIAGGDIRLRELARMMAEDSEREVFVWGLGEFPEKNVHTLFSPNEIPLPPSELILPVPLSDDGKHLFSPLAGEQKILPGSLAELCPAGSLVFCGRADQHFCDICRQKQLLLTDCLKDESFTVRNAAASAEAAAMLAAQLRKRSFLQSRVLVLGGGRIARNLLRILASCGAETVCAARAPEQRVWASLEGAESVPFDRIPSPGQVDAVFSAVPSPVLGEKELALFRNDCLLMELGSYPGGIDREAAARLGKNYVSAGALPGKMLPLSAAEWIYELILRKEADFYGK